MSTVINREDVTQNMLHQVIQGVRSAVRCIPEGVYSMAIGNDRWDVIADHQHVTVLLNNRCYAIRMRH